ncbi:MAG: phospho-sugar mutase [Tissierellia bacterium]|nr:phospho-sugar mutase [Tissierellia bacterium]
MNYLEKYKYWVTNEFFDADTRKELEAIKGNEEEIKNRFYKDLTFGTAGLRGIIGAGTNRMNKYTVALATQGLAATILSKGEKAKNRGVAIAYDVRHFSKDFASIAARVLAANGIVVYLFDDIRPTPLLSYTIRKLGTISGIVITASHNPKDYNGYKVYWEEGSQILEDIATEILNNINKIKDFSEIKIIELEEGIEKGLVKYIGKEIDEDYIEKVISSSLRDDVDKEISVIYSPLNGTGNKFVRKVLEDRGFTNVFVVPEQENPDPDFKTVGYPNPEDVKAFEYSERYGREKDADILLATDPDCDRVGCMVKGRDGEFISINGNDIGALLVNYILSTRYELGNIPQNAAIVKSIVTGDLSKAIAEKYNVKVIETLTGFKHICGKANEFDKTKEYTFLFGYEESIGYVYDTFVRDKDGVISSMLIVEMAAYYKKQGKTLLDILEELYNEHGYYLNKLISIVLEGIEGSERIERIMESFRKEPITEINDMKLIKTIDYLKDETDTPRSNVLKYFFDDNSWYAVRPSGTEPKLKIYIYTRGDNRTLSEKKIIDIEKKVMDKIESVK